ncbi:MAG TPA: hypothetical protein VHP54_04045 [Caproiciproducens sp.]|nr:hypothetical protein [Caproiciproducens sp.]
MTLTTSSNNSRREFRETYFWSLKKVRGMAALLALLMFIACPMILMVAMSNTKRYENYKPQIDIWVDTYTRYFSILCIFVVLLILLFVIVNAVMLFSYLHQKRSVDLFHSLPVGRTPMLLGRYCAALTVLFAPLLFNFIIVSVIGLSYGVAPQYSLANVAVQMLWIMLMSTAALSFSVFMAICTGTSFDMVISILGINVAYPLLIFVSDAFASQLLPGLNMELKPSSTVLTALAPFAASFLPLIDGQEGLTGYPSGTSSPDFLIWWILFTLILFAGSLLLYKKRKSECAESSFAFPIPKIIIRFIITAVAGIGFGMILMMATSLPANFFIGVVSGSLAAHIVVEAVYSRGFQQMKKSFTWYAVFALSFVLFYGVLATGFFGYDTRVPSAGEVQSIRLEAPGEYSYSGDVTIYNAETNRELSKIVPVIKEQTNIDNVRELHKNFVDENRKTIFPYSINTTNYSRLTLTYHLKNGSVLKRSYLYDSTDKNVNAFQSRLKDMTNRIAEIKEYRQTSSILFYLDPEYIGSISLSIFSGKAQTKELPVIPDANAKQELLEAMKQDYLNGTINDPNAKQDSSAAISIDYGNPVTVKEGKLKDYLGGFSGKVYLSGSNYFNLTGSSENTLKLIDKYGWTKQLTSANTIG